MLKIELNLFEPTDISAMAGTKVRLICLEFQRSRLRTCDLCFFNSMEGFGGKKVVPFKGRFFEQESILVPAGNELLNLTLFNCCSIVTPLRNSKAMGVSPDEHSVILRYKNE